MAIVAAPTGLQAAVQRVMDIAGRQPQAAALANLGMLALAGLSSRRIARNLPPLISRVMPVAPMALCWCDSNGAMTDLCSNDPRLISAGSRLAAGNAKSPAWPRFADIVNAGPVAGTLLRHQSAPFRASTFHRVTLGRVNAEHILDAVVHDGDRPLGCLMLLRSADGGPFTTGEVALARAIADLLLPAFDRDVAPTPGRRVPAGVALVAANGAVTLCTPAAHSSLWSLTGDAMELAHAGVADLLHRVCGEGLVLARAAGMHGEEHSTRWGEIVVRYDRGDAGDVMIRFDQRVPHACHIALTIDQLPLSPRRVVVCWLLLQGLSRKEIAWAMQLSPETVNDHLDALFATLGVNSAAAAMRAFWN